jgi:ribosomal protein L29
MQVGRIAQPFTAARPVVGRRPMLVVAVKPSKAADFRSLSDDEIRSKIVSLKSELASVRFLQRTRGVAEVKPGEMAQPDPEKVPKANLNKHIRRQVAQLWTVWRERQIKEGINKRDSRKMLAQAALGVL